MLDINLIRENPEIVRKALRDRQMDSAPVDILLSLDTDRRNLLVKVEALKAQRNTVSKEISQLKDPAEKQAKIEAMRAGGRRDRPTGRDRARGGRETAGRAGLHPQPARPLHALRQGRQRERGAAHRGEASRNSLSPPCRTGNWVPNLGIIDFERGVKLTGSRFYVLNGAAARLQRALIAWMLDLHIRQGYEERYTPFMVKAETLFAAGQLPKFVDNLYHDIEEDLWMVPTAEVPLTGMYKDEVLEESHACRSASPPTPPVSGARK